MNTYIILAVAIVVAVVTQYIPNQITLTIPAKLKAVVFALSTGIAANVIWQIIQQYI